MCLKGTQWLPSPPSQCSQRSGLWSEPQEGAEPRLRNMHWGLDRAPLFCYLSVFTGATESFMSLHHDPCHRKTNRVIVLLKPGLKLRAQTQTRFLTQPKVATSLRSLHLSPFFSSACLARSCCLHSKYHQLINQVTETCNSSFSDWRWQIMVINSSRREGSGPHFHM